MLRLKNLSNKYQKRLIRPLYANTQATPYAATLDSTFRNADGTIHLPQSGDTTPFTGPRTAAAYTLNNSLVPGIVMVRSSGEAVGVADGTATAQQPFGLLANFIGGDFDEGFSGDSLQNEVGVWRGPDSVFEILAPGFQDAAAGGTQALTTAISAATVGIPVLLFAGPDGRLSSFAAPGSRVAVARLIDRVSASRIVVDLLV
jgi:hypothetical protein